MQISSLLGGADQLLPTFLSDLYRWGRSYVLRSTKLGAFEVLNYESTLEIMDVEGKHGKFNKVEKVRFIQNNLVAVQDQLWGFKKSITDYKCSPGAPVDFYQVGYKTYVVISLREVKSKDDEEVFNFQWHLCGKPVMRFGFWETNIDRFTHDLHLKIIFPEERPPIRLWMIEANHNRTIELDKTKLTQLPDKRWQITWESNSPRLNETYTMKWDW